MVGMGGISLEQQWHNLSIEDCLVAQESTESGISVDEVLARRCLLYTSDAADD